MSTEIQNLSNKNLDAVKVLVSEMFSPESFSIVEQAMKNPLLEQYPDVSLGEVAIKDGKPVAFRMAVLRRLYYGQKPILGVVGSTLCSKKGTPGALLLGLLRRNTASRGGSEIFFTNTSCAASGKLNRAVGVKGQGPDSSAVDHVAIVRLIPALAYLLRKALKRGVRQVPMPSVDKEFSTRIADLVVSRAHDLGQSIMDAFWEKYLKGNKGLVCSRSGAEIDWMFGDRIREGSMVLLQALRENVLIGYVVLNLTSDGAVRVLDIIALGNDNAILKALLKASRKFIRTCTNHFLLKIAGYPPGHSEVFESVFKLKRPFGYNPCLYKFEKGSEIDLAQMTSSDSWFFGPYDGDLAMG